MPRFIHYRYQGKEEYGLLEAEDRIRRLTGDPFRGYQSEEGSLAPVEIQMLPVCRPSKIIALGLELPGSRPGIQPGGAGRAVDFHEAALRRYRRRG